MKLEVVTLYHVGLKRKINEDNYIFSKDIATTLWTKSKSENFAVPSIGSLFIVADGMGGEAAGEVASDLAIQAIQLFLSEKLQQDLYEKDISTILSDALLEANKVIKKHVKKDPATYGMGTTATICYIVNNKLFIAWVGDSRVYRYSIKSKSTSHGYFHKNLEILTNDHSLVWEEVKKGLMSPEEARVAVNSNIITQSLGDIHKDPVPEIKMFDLYKDDIIIACSDGLNGMISDAHMHDLIESSGSIDEMKQVLLKAALDGGGLDNITAIILNVETGIVYAEQSSANTLFNEESLQADKVKETETQFLDDDDKELKPKLEYNSNKKLDDSLSQSSEVINSKDGKVLSSYKSVFYMGILIAVLCSAYPLVFPVEFNNLKASFMNKFSTKVDEANIHKTRTNPIPVKTLKKDIDLPIEKDTLKEKYVDELFDDTKWQKEIKEMKSELDSLYDVIGKPSQDLSNQYIDLRTKLNLIDKESSIDEKIEALEGIKELINQLNEDH